MVAWVMVTVATTIDSAGTTTGCSQPYVVSVSVEPPQVCVYDASTVICSLSSTNNGMEASTVSEAVTLTPSVFDQVSMSLTVFDPVILVDCWTVVALTLVTLSSCSSVVPFSTKWSMSYVMACASNSTTLSVATQDVVSAPPPTLTAVTQTVCPALDALTVAS